MQFSVIPRTPPFEGQHWSANIQSGLLTWKIIFSIYLIYTKITLSLEAYLKLCVNNYKQMNVNLRNNIHWRYEVKINWTGEKNRYTETTLEILSKWPAATGSRLNSGNMGRKLGCACSFSSCFIYWCIFWDITCFKYSHDKSYIYIYIYTPMQKNFAHTNAKT